MGEEQQRKTDEHETDETLVFEIEAFVGEEGLKTEKQKEKDDDPIPIPESDFEQNQHEGADFSEFPEDGDREDDENDACQFIVKRRFLFFLFIDVPFLFLPHKNPLAILYRRENVKKGRKI